jgi:formylglycine-generating enzyme required for sulfatase activity
MTSRLFPVLSIAISVYMSCTELSVDNGLLQKDLTKKDSVSVYTKPEISVSGASIILSKIGSLGKTENTFTIDETEDRPYSITFIKKELPDYITMDSVIHSDGSSKTVTIRLGEPPADDDDYDYVGKIYLGDKNGDGNVIDSVTVHVIIQSIPHGMVFIPAEDSVFTMGTDGVAEIIEKPAHEVELTRDYWMDSTEITQELYQRIAQKGNPSKHVSDLLPVENVTWYDAVLFCNERSKQHGLDTVYTYTGVSDTGALEEIEINLTSKGYRLPTEAEWEYACRAGTESTYFWGESGDSKIIDDYLWYSGNSDGETHPVALKNKNMFGLYDMPGNVAEWCNDLFRDEPYPSMKQTQPMITESDRKERIVRGGNFSLTNSLPSDLTSCGRDCELPEQGFKTIGFRCVLVH